MHAPGVLGILEPKLATAASEVWAAARSQGVFRRMFLSGGVTVYGLKEFGVGPDATGDLFSNEWLTPQL